MDNKTLWQNLIESGAEWAYQEEEWVFGIKIRGIVRHAHARVWGSTSWTWRTARNEGFGSTLVGAVNAAEKDLDFLPEE